MASRHRCGFEWGAGTSDSSLLSIVAHAAGFEFVLDPGTLRYAGSLKARDSLRSASAHSTLRPRDAEPRRLLEKFRTAPAARVQVEKSDEWLQLKAEFTSDFSVERRLRLACGPRMEIWVKYVTSHRTDSS